MRTLLACALLLSGCNSCSPRPHVGRTADAGPAVVILEPRSAPRPVPGHELVPLVDETEPNDELGRAQPLEFPKGVRGTVSAARGAGGKPDVDLFQWLVGGDTPRQLARVEVNADPGGGPVHVELLDGDGALVAAGQAGEKGVEVIPNVPVEAGKTYHLRVRALPVKDKGTAPASPPGTLPYTLVVGAAALLPGEEEEPNDNVARANPLTAGVEASGYFGRVRDEDWLRLPAELPAGGTLQLELVAPEGVSASLRLRDAGGATLAEARAGGASELRLRNAPSAPGGLLVLRADKGKNLDERWRLRMSTEAALPGAEVEPNGSAATATPVDTSGGSGQVAGFLWPGDVDVYRFRSTAAGALRIDAVPPPGVDLKLERLNDAGSAADRTDSAGAGKPERLDLRTTGRDILVRITARPRDTAFEAPYSLSFTFTAGPAAADGGAP